jgi:hypothetical protein
MYTATEQRVFIRLSQNRSIVDHNTETETKKYLIKLLY